MAFDCPLKVKEYNLLLTDDIVKHFISDTRIRGICRKSKCEIHLTKRIVNRRVNHQWIKFGVIQVIGKDDKSIEKCNRLLERIFPWYLERKSYDRKAAVRIRTDETIPDNTELEFHFQRTGPVRPFFKDFRIDSPFETEGSRGVRTSGNCQWKTTSRELNGYYEPDQSNLVEFLNFRSSAITGQPSNEVMMPNLFACIDKTNAPNPAMARDTSNKKGINIHNNIYYNGKLHCNSLEIINVPNKLTGRRRNSPSFTLESFQDPILNRSGDYSKGSSFHPFKFDSYDKNQSTEEINKILDIPDSNEMNSVDNSNNTVPYEVEVISMLENDPNFHDQLTFSKEVIESNVTGTGEEFDYLISSEYPESEVKQWERVKKLMQKEKTSMKKRNQSKKEQKKVQIVSRNDIQSNDKSKNNENSKLISKNQPQTSGFLSNRRKKILQNQPQQ